jgi:hypothetical protein
MIKEGVASVAPPKRCLAKTVAPSSPNPARTEPADFISVTHWYCGTC